MTIFLLSLCAFGILLVGGILWYQKKNIKSHTDENGNLVDQEENPFSIKNIHTSRSKIQHFIKEEIMYLIVGLLKILIRLRRFSRRTLDRGITKLASVAFPEEKLNGPINENTILSHVEEHKKTADKGQLHL
jgi:hypothetical protein